MVAEYQHDTAQSSPILDAQWAPAAMQIGTAGANQTVGIFDCTSRQSQTLGNHDQPVRCLRFLPDQQNTLVTGSWDKTIRVRPLHLWHVALRRAATRAARRLLLSDGLADLALVLANDTARTSRDEAAA